jgi:hypothetical protein
VEKRLEAARETVRVGKLSGAVGTHAHLDPKIEAASAASSASGARGDFHPDLAARPPRGIRGGDRAGGR